MNWSRGMLRLWIVASVVWVPAALVMVGDAQQQHRLRNNLPSAAWANGDTAAVVAAAALPPLAVLLFFGIVRWVWRGFKPQL